METKITYPEDIRIAIFTKLAELTGYSKEDVKESLVALMTQAADDFIENEYRHGVDNAIEDLRDILRNEMREVSNDLERIERELSNDIDDVRGDALYSKDLVDDLEEALKNDISNVQSDLVALDERLRDIECK